MIISGSSRGITDHSSAIRLTFLGGFALDRPAAESPPPVRQQKLVAILALAALSPGRAVPAAHAVRLLWGDSDERLAKRSLNQLLHGARRLYPGLLVRLRPDDRLVLGEGVSSDVTEALAGTWLDEAASPPDPRSCELLPGFAVTGCDAFADLLDTARGQLASAISKAAMRRGSRETGAARLDWLSLAYQLDRTSEETAAGYFAEVAAAQGHAACWAAYTAHRDWLEERYDLAPSATLTRTVLELCRSRAHVAPAPTGTVPASPDAPPHPEPAAPVRTQARAWRFTPRWLQAAGALAVLAVLSWAVVRMGGSPELRADATSSAAALRFEYPGGDAGLASMVGAVAEHLAAHGIQAETRALGSGQAGAGVLLAARDVAPHLVPLDGAAIGSSFAEQQAALFDSALAVVARAPTPIPAAARDDDPRLAAARLRFDDALELSRTGGPSAALLMLAVADSLAGAAHAAAPKEPAALLLQSQIAQYAFWMEYLSGTAGADTRLLDKAVRLAAAAVDAGAGAEALVARGDANYSRWVFGQPGSEPASLAATEDYEAALRLAPGDARAWIRLAGVYHAHGRLSDAYSAAARSLDSTPGRHDAQAYMTLFLAALDQGDNQHAARWCAELAFHFPRDWGAAACAVMIAWADPASPMPAKQPALFDAPSGMRPVLERRLELLIAGAELARGGDPAPILARVGRLAPLAAEDPDADPIMAGILVEQGLVDSARVVLRRYIAAAPTRSTARYRPWMAAAR